MKLSTFLVFLLTILFLSCDSTPNFDTGPCKFAPSDSNFPFIEKSCEECYFNLRFQDKEYFFPGNRISPSFGGDYSKMWNVFFEFYLDPPDSDEALYSSIDVKTPLMKREVIINGISSPPLVSSAFGIYNYCNNFFEPITDDISQSYHRLTKAELIESYPVEIDSEPYQLFVFCLNGELQATIIVNGNTQLVTAEYQLKSFVYKKL